MITRWGGCSPQGTMGTACTSFLGTEGDTPDVLRLVTSSLAPLREKDRDTPPQSLFGGSGLQPVASIPAASVQRLCGGRRVEPECGQLSASYGEGCPKAWGAPRPGTKLGWGAGAHPHTRPPACSILGNSQKVPFPGSTLDQYSEPGQGQRLQS